MAKLTMLKPRIPMANLSRVKMAPSINGSWRDGKEGSTARGYGYKWQKARERFLREHPLCCYCERIGRVTPATIVDHIIPHEGDDSLMWNESNWQPLCKPCHDSTKKAEEARAGRGSHL